MKKFFLFALALCLIAPLGMAQVNEQGPQGSSNIQTVASNNNSSRALGDLNWYLDIEGLTGDIRLLGVAYDDNTGNIWCTGAYDFSIAYIYEVDYVNGVVVNTYTQPSSHWGGWGWRDLAFDGKYMYAGNPNAGYIQQIDTSNGQPTGVQYGPFPITPCRALAYDPVSDSFWTASFSSSIYQCFRDNSYNTYSGAGLTHYGAGMEETNNMIWWWSQDGATGTLASEYDPATQTLTGDFFEATTPLAGGIAGGAGGHDMGGGAWELIGMFQGSPDHAAGFDLGTVAPSLVADVKEIEAITGGTINFKMDAGVANGGRYYGLFGGFTGSSPGTPLPGGMTVLPVNWDVVTDALINLNPTGFFSNLDGNGMSKAQLVIPPILDLSRDTTLTFAFCLQGAPWDFASNFVDVVLKAPVSQKEYIYDDGETDNLLGWTNGGEMAWIHFFKAFNGADTLTQVATAFGSALYTGYNPGNGTPAVLYVWDDPTNDNDPMDAVFLQKLDVTVVNVDMDIVNYFNLTAPQPVTAGFFIGASQMHNAGQFVAPMDMDTPYGGEAWVAGNVGGAFDYNNFNNNLVYEMGLLGLPSYFLLRARN